MNKTKSFYQLASSILLLIFLSACSHHAPKLNSENIDNFNQQTYEQTKEYLNNKSEDLNSLKTSGKNWKVILRGYDKGDLIFDVTAESKKLSQTIKIASNKAKKTLNTEYNNQTRLWMAASDQNGRSFSWVEYQGRALEIVEQDLVAIRTLNKEIIKDRIFASKDYLLRSMNNKHYAFYRLYKAKEAIADSRLRTIYSASSLWTLMRMHDLEKDPEIARRIPHIANFLLSMQVKSGALKGAFHHSISSRNGKKENFFVVGTASKTIFTLLDLYRRFQDKRYLNAAKNGGDWLLTKQRTDGTISSYDLIKNNKIKKGSKYSTLYHGQVLSALSRLYRSTGEKRFLTGAKKLANIIKQRALKDRYYLQDDYRLSDDPVPTAWGIMSLLDFYKAQPDQNTKAIITKLFRELVSHQLRNENNIADYGRYPGTFGTSGNGWISEVYSEMYLHGSKVGWEPELLADVKKSIALISRWLIQNSYTKENTYFLKNPDKAIGGFIRYPFTEEVRTDAVCHGVNSLLYMLPTWPDGTLLKVPE